MLIKIKGSEELEIENVSGKKILVTKIRIESGNGSEYAIQYCMRKEKSYNGQPEIHTISGTIRIGKGADQLKPASASEGLLVIPAGFRLFLNIECSGNRIFSGIAHINFEVIG